MFSGLANSKHPCRQLLDEADGILTQIFRVILWNDEVVVETTVTPKIFRALRRFDEALRICPDDPALLVAKAIVLFFADPTDTAKQYLKKALTIDPGLLEARCLLEYWTNWKNVLEFPRWDKGSNKLDEVIAKWRFQHGHAAQIVRDGLQKAVALIYPIENVPISTTEIKEIKLRVLMSLTPYGPLVAPYLWLWTGKPDSEPQILESFIPILTPSNLPQSMDGYYLVHQLAGQNYCIVILVKDHAVCLTQRLIFSESVQIELGLIRNFLQTSQFLMLPRIEDAVKWHQQHVPHLYQVFEDLLPPVIIESSINQLKRCKMEQVDRTKDVLSKIYELGRQATAYLFREDLSSARRRQEEALALVRSIDESHVELKCLKNLICITAELGNLDTTLRLFGELQSVAERIGYRSAIIECLESIGGRGSTLVQSGKCSRAIRCFEAVQKIAQDIVNRDLEAEAIRGLANVYLEMGLWKKAIPLLENAIALAEEHRLVKTLSSGLNDLGDAYYNLGDVDLAIRFHERALKVARESGYRKAEGISLGDLGNCYLELGKVQEACAYYEKALEIADAIGDAENACLWLPRLGSIYSVIDPLLSIKYLNKARDIARSMYYPARELTVLFTLGAVYRTANRLTDAKINYERALFLAESIHDRSKRAKICTHLGVCHMFLKDYDQARKYFELAVEITRKLKEPLGEAIGLVNLGSLLLAQGFKEDSFQNYLKAVNFLDAYRSRLWLDHEKSFLQRYTELFDNVILLSMELGHLQEGFVLCEKAKSMALNRRFARMGFVPKGQFPKGKIEEFLRIRNELRQMELQIERVERERFWSGAHQLRSAQASLIERYQFLMEEFARSGMPQLQNWSLTPGVGIGLKIEPGSGILELFVTASNCLAFLMISSGQVFVTSIDGLGRKQLQHFITNSWDPCLKSPHHFGQVLKAEVFDKIAKAVHLLLKSSGLLTRSRIPRITIVPHFALHILPLHLLPIGGEILQEITEEISYAPNLSFLKAVEVHTPRKLEKLLVINNPENNLPFASTEVRMVRDAGIFQTIKELNSSDATLEHILEESTTADMIHFACHGGFKQDDPFESYLRVKDSIELTVSRLLSDLYLERAGIIVLSACETGLTKPDDVDEYIGLPHAFLAAGAVVVISTLWRVEDLSTSYLMGRFYQYLQQQKQEASTQSYVLCPVRALVKAKRSLCEVTREEILEWAESSGQYRQPRIKKIKKMSKNAKPYSNHYYWGAFVSIGAPQIAVTQ